MLVEVPKPPSQGVKPWWQLWEHRSLAKLLLYSKPPPVQAQPPQPGQALGNPTHSWHAAAGSTGRWQQETSEGKAPKELRGLFAAFPRESWDTSPRGGLSPECRSRLFSRQLAALGAGHGESAQLAVSVGRGPGKALYQHSRSPECTNVLCWLPGPRFVRHKGNKTRGSLVCTSPVTPAEKAAPGQPPRLHRARPLSWADPRGLGARERTRPRPGAAAALRWWKSALESGCCAPRG